MKDAIENALFTIIALFVFLALHFVLLALPLMLMVTLSNYLWGFLYVITIPIFACLWDEMI